MWGPGRACVPLKSVAAFGNPADWLIELNQSRGFASPARAGFAFVDTGPSLNSWADARRTMWACDVENVCAGRWGAHDAKVRR